MYPKRGLDSLTTILNGSPSSDDSIAQQVFMVHITKRNIIQEQFLYLMSKTTLMKIIEPTSEREQWLQLIRKVIEHKEVL